MNIVQIRITSSGKVKKCEEGQARRFAKANPEEYRIIEPPVIEVAQLPPVEKKKVAVGGPVKELNAGQDIPSDKTPEKNEPVNKMEDVLQGKLKPTLKRRARRTKK